MTVKSGPNVKIKRSKKDFSKYDSLDEEIRSFIKSIKNKKKPIVSANDGINVLKCATKISNLIKK
jgi:predicted dehydrogenase